MLPGTFLLKSLLLCCYYTGSGERGSLALVCCLLNIQYEKCHYRTDDDVFVRIFIVTKYLTSFRNDKQIGLFWLREELLSVGYPTCLGSQLAVCVAQKSESWLTMLQCKSCWDPMSPLFLSSLFPFPFAAKSSSNANCQF